MTDTERKRIKAICEVANVADIGDLSDGFHTFNGLYYQRMILFAALVRAYKDRAWKSYRHEDGGLCFGDGWFIVGIDTPEGSYTYHFENVYFDYFDCVELPNGKHWDGHTEDNVTRLLSLPTVSPDEARSAGKWISVEERLPEQFICVFATDGEDVGVAAFQGFIDDYPVWSNEWNLEYVEDQYDEDFLQVTHWMPLPEPQKEVK